MMKPTSRGNEHDWNIAIHTQPSQPSCRPLFSLSRPLCRHPHRPWQVIHCLSSTTTAVRAQVTALGANRTYTYVPTNNKSVGDPIVTAYWTPERMKSAIPTDTPTSTTEVNRQIDELKQPALADEPVTDGSSPVTAILNAITPQAVTPDRTYLKDQRKSFLPQSDRRQGLRMLWSLRQ